MDTPKYYEFMNPILQALQESGGTLTNEEIVDVVARIMHLHNEIMERRQAGHANMGEVEYRIAWAKSYLKHTGYLTQSARGIWALTPQGKDADTVDVRAIVTEVRQAIGLDGKPHRRSNRLGNSLISLPKMSQRAMHSPKWKRN
jgi:restriction system protein